jgi:hypothetical protein
LQNPPKQFRILRRHRHEAQPLRQKDPHGTSHFPSRA